MNENNVETGIYTNANGEEIEFSFNASPSMGEKILFVKSVVDTVVGEDYLYIAKDMFFDFYLINLFTDVDMSEFGFNVDQDNEVDIDLVSLVENVVDNTAIADIVKNKMDSNVLYELESSVDLDIEYKTGIKQNSVEEALANILNTLDKKIADINELEMIDIAKKISGMSGYFTPDKLLDAYASSESFRDFVATKNA